MENENSTESRLEQLEALRGVIMDEGLKMSRLE